MSDDAIDWTLKHSKLKMEISDDVKAHLLIEVDGRDIDILYDDCEKISNVMEQFDCGDILLADSQSQKDKLWKIRIYFSNLKANFVYKEEDTVVPRADLAKLFESVKQIGNKYGFLDFVMVTLEMGTYMLIF